jgi:putative phage-type endonuclease
MSAPQGSEAWFAARAGHCTASRFHDVMATVQKGEAAGRRNYRWQLVTERLTGIPCESYQNAAMLWGIENEPRAREAYEIETGDDVQLVEFIKHPDLPFVGASPDGLIQQRRGLEIKCPHSSVIHVQTLSGGMPAEHVPQVQGGMWVCDLEEWVFVSFDPRMPEKLRLYTEIVKRDDAYIDRLAKSVVQFNAEVEQLYQQITRMAA